MVRFYSWLFLFALFVFTNQAKSTPEWKTQDGQVQTAEIVDFDFNTKSLILENPETGSRSKMQSSDLDREGKLRLLFQPAFHAALNGRTPEISAARRYLLGIFAFTPAIILYAGFWIAGWLVGGTANPIRALIGFFGAWITAIIFMLCYFMLSARTGGGSGVLWFGAGVASVFVSIFISAVYGCKVWKGFVIFLAQFFTTLLLGAILAFTVDRLLPEESVNKALEVYLFRPAGVLKP